MGEIIENLKNDETRIILPKYGGPEFYVVLLEQEKRPVKLRKLVRIVDNEMGAEFEENTDSMMRKAVKFEEDKTLITLAGYSHLLLAELMYDKKYPKDEINKEIDKACALLDLAHRGGRHPYLPRAMKLKRIVNLKDFVKLGISVVLLALVILFVAFIIGKISQGKLDFL